MYSLTGSRARGVFACAVLTLTIALMLALASSANAAYTVPNFSVGASPDQAAGHPKLSVSIDPDAAKADSTGGDDLRDVTIDAPVGMIFNQSAATTKCSDSQLAADTCPGASVVGTIQVKWRTLTGGSITAPGTAYVMTTPSAANSASLGFVLRPTTSYRKSTLRATITNTVPLTAPTRAAITSISRTVQTTSGLTVLATIDQIDLTLNAQANATASGPYFTLNPSSCTAATTSATIRSWSGVSVAKSSAFNPTGCAGVPFAPTASVTPTVQTASAATGVSASFSVPTVSAAIQNSVVSAVAATLPAGTKLNTAAINAVTSLCSTSQHAADACPSASKIGTASVTLPNVSAALAGDVYLMTRSASTINFGYILRNTSLGVRLPLKGSASNVDLNADGVADAVRAVASGLPQVPWSAAAFNVTSKLVTNPANGCPASIASTKLDGWSGGAATLTNQWFSPTANCTPDTSITSGPSGPTASSNATFTYESTISGSTFECQLDGGPWGECSPLGGLAQGPHIFCVRAVSSGIADPTPACASFSVDTITPFVIASCQPNQALSVNCTWTVDDPTATVKCLVDGSLKDPCPNPIVISGAGAHSITITATDPVGNAGSTTRSIVIDPPPPPTVVITAPAISPVYVSTTSINVQYLVNGSSTIPAGTICTVTNLTSGVTNPSYSTTTNAVALVIGTNNVRVSCNNAYGVGSATTIVVPGDPWPVLITSPANNSWFSTSPINVTYAVGGQTTIPAGTFCTLNGVPTTTPNTNSVTLMAGPNTITLSCSSAFGSTLTAITVNRDNTPPSIGQLSLSQASAPGPATLTYGSADNSGIAPTCTPPSGSIVNLVPGANNISVTCIDLAGNSATSSLSIVVPGGTGSLAVTLVGPTGVTTNTTPTFTWSVNQPESGTLPCQPGQSCVQVIVPFISYTCAMDDAPVSCGGHSYTSPALPLGNHRFCVTARGIYSGGTSTDCRSFTIVDGPPAAPTVAIVSPPNNMWTNTGSVNVAFTVDGAAAIPPGTTCTVGTASNTAATTSATSNSVALAAGSNIITVNCTNAGGSTPVSVTVNRDNTPPTIGELSLSQTTQPGDATLTYSSSDDSGFSPACTPPSGSTVTLVEGANEITVTCTDVVGNAANAALSVIVPGSGEPGPQVAITSPADGAQTTLSSIPLEYAVEPADATCDFPSGASRPLSLGVNSLAVTCVGASGGSTTATVTVTRASQLSSGASCVANNNTITCSTHPSGGFSPYTSTCYIDGILATCGVPKTVPAGTHSGQACATDSIGGRSCIVFDFITTPTAPALQINGACVSNTTTASCSFSVGGGVPPYTATCMLQNGTFQGAQFQCFPGQTITFVLANVAFGASLRVCATDSIGTTTCKFLPISGGSGPV